MNDGNMCGDLRVYDEIRLFCQSQADTDHSFLSRQRKPLKHIYNNLFTNYNYYLVLLSRNEFKKKKSITMMRGKSPPS